MRRSLFASLSAILAVLGLALPLTSCGSSGGGKFSNSSLVTITTTTVPPATTGQENYSVLFTADFPHTPGTFALVGGALPVGMKLNSFTGELSGVPRLIGTYHFTIAAMDGIDNIFPNNGDQTFAQDSKPYTLPVTLGPPNLLAQVLPAGVYHSSYSYQLDAVGGTPPYTFTDVTTGMQTGLPAGLAVSPTGVIGSLPNASNGVLPYTFRVRVTDSLGLFDEQNLQVVVVVPLLIIFTPSPLPAGAAVVPYSKQLTLASNGAGAPIIWTQKFQASPPAPPNTPLAGETWLDDIDMEITQDGLLRSKIGFAGPRLGSPNPLIPYTKTFTIQVKDGLVPTAQVDSRQYSLTVNPGPVLYGINPNRASAAGPFVATGVNFQAGATLEFKPGLGSSTITPLMGGGGTTLTFNNAPSVPTGGTGSVSVKVLNPDGGNFTLPNAFTFPAANLSFNTKVFVASALSSSGLDVIDVNGDGKADMVHSGTTGLTTYSGGASSNAAGLNLHMNLGGSPPTFTTVSLTSNSIYDVKFVDFTFDGKPDIIAIGASQLFTWINTGVTGTTGNFVAGPTSTLAINGTGQWPTEMAIGKFNADAFVDVVYGCPHYPVSNINGRVHSMLGTGGGNFAQTDASFALTNSYGTGAMQCIDADGDGISEVCSGTNMNPYTGDTFRYTTMSAGFFSGWQSRGPVTTGTPGYGCTRAMAVGDFLGNGGKQLLTCHTGSPNYSASRLLSIFSGSGLNTQLTLTPPGYTTGSACAVDGDFDAKMDWAITMMNTTGSPANIVVYRGSTQGITQTIDIAAGSPTTSNPRPGRLASGDLDGDGKPDIACTTSYWGSEGMANNYGSTYNFSTAGASGNGGTMGIVIYLNTSN